MTTYQDDEARPAAATEIPEGFDSVDRGGPYFMLMAPVYVRLDEDCAVLGMRLERKHTNALGIAHGGMLATVADGALGMNLTRSQSGEGSWVTAQLSLDFLGPARLGDWLEAHARIVKSGRTLSFAECTIFAASRPVMRAHGVFMLAR